MMIEAPHKNDSIYQYFLALERLIGNKPIRVPKGTTITLRSVALEAGKSAGSIRKERPVYEELIKEIKRQAAEHNTRAKPMKEVHQSIRRWKDEAEQWRKLYHQALARELMLLHQLDGAENLLRNKENVYHFPGKEDRPEPI